MADTYQWISEFLKNGGSSNQAVNGSVTPVNFDYVVAAGDDVYVNRIIVHLEDNTGIDSGSYGGISPVAALTNGITLNIVRADAAMADIDLLDGEPVQTNADWAKFCYDVSVSNFGSGNEALTIRWTFAGAGKPIHLFPGDTFRMTIRDDLTSLVAHSANIQGWSE